jgi:hypothetical protein
MSKLDRKTITLTLVLFLACGNAERMPCSSCEATGGSSSGNTSTPGIGGESTGGESTGGTAGGAGNTSTAGSAGVAGGVAVCAPAMPAPSQLWSFTLGNGGEAGGAGGADSAGGGASSGSGGEAQGPCQPTAQAWCQGEVRVGGTESAPRLTFSDGSTLVYSSTAVAAPVFPEGHAWASVQHETIPDCPFCGSRDRYALEIRTVESGPVLFVELSGGIAQAPSAEVLAQVFGAKLRRIPNCQSDFRFACNQVNRTELDLSVTTNPEQLLQHAEVTRVTSSAGELFDVLFSLGEDRVTHISSCFDGPSVRADSTFIASRVGP